MTEGLKHHPELPPDPKCKACRQGWPIHADENGEHRSHLDFCATPEFGVIQPCPTEDWPDEDDDETEK